MQGVPPPVSAAAPTITLALVTARVAGEDVVSCVPTVQKPPPATTRVSSAPDAASDLRVTSFGE